MFIGDVSSHNTVTNWNAYAADTPAVWAKATQASGGDAYVNPKFGDQFHGAVGAGMLAGAYHFADVRHDPAADADYFVSVAGPAGAFADGRLLPMLDVENTTGVNWTASNTSGWVSRFIQRYRQVTGRSKIIVYASRSFWQTIMNPDQWAYDDVFLMVAAYPGAVDWSQGLNQSGWTHPRLAVWQYTDVAPIAGMQAPGDRSRQVAFTQADLTLGAATTEGSAEVGDRWFIRHLDAQGNDTGEMGMLTPTDDLIGVTGTNWSDVVKANGVPVLNAPDGIWEDFRTRLDNRQQKLAQDVADALYAKLTEGGGSATPHTVTVTVDGKLYTATPAAS
jgi:GH25 family lysozyme M1 (1,4-beta-N-acetylmuramidase)